MAQVFQSCSWCHELNEMTGAPVYCWNCGHRGDVARVDCDCDRCTFVKMYEACWCS